jgi:hypothetical protein
MLELGLLPAGPAASLVQLRRDSCTLVKDSHLVAAPSPDPSGGLPAVGAGPLAAPGHLRFCAGSAGGARGESGPANAVAGDRSRQGKIRASTSILL